MQWMRCRASGFSRVEMGVLLRSAVAAADKIDGLQHSRPSKSTPRNPQRGQNCPQNAEKLEIRSMNFSTSLYPQPNLSWQLLESNQMVTLVCTDINVPKYSHGHSLCTHIFTMYVSFYLGVIYPLVTQTRHLTHAQLSAMINPTRVQSIVIIRCIIHSYSFLQTTAFLEKFIW